MKSSRLEAFSDGVLAIIITIMVLELKPPHGEGLEALRPLVPILLSYLLSFAYVGIYWNNHHHLLQAAERVDGSVLWANLHLLFWLSLIPFVTDWVGESHGAALPTAAYGVILLLSAFAYWLLQGRLIAVHGGDSTLAQAIGRDWKGKLSPLLYLSGIGLSFVRPWLADLIYVGVALLWFIPDRRISRRLAHEAPRG